VLKLPYLFKDAQTHMINSTAPNCTYYTDYGATNTSCAYDSKSLTLTLRGPLFGRNGSANNASFMVSSFTNPYNGIPKGGFSLCTADEQGN